METNEKNKNNISEINLEEFRKSLLGDVNKMSVKLVDSTSYINNLTPDERNIVSNIEDIDVIKTVINNYREAKIQADNNQKQVQQVQPQQAQVQQVQPQQAQVQPQQAQVQPQQAQVQPQQAQIQPQQTQVQPQQAQVQPQQTQLQQPNYQDEIKKYQLAQIENRSVVPSMIAPYPLTAQQPQTNQQNQYQNVNNVLPNIGSLGNIKQDDLETSRIKEGENLTNYCVDKMEKKIKTRGIDGNIFTDWEIKSVDNIAQKLYNPDNTNF